MIISPPFAPELPSVLGAVCDAALQNKPLLLAALQALLLPACAGAAALRLELTPEMGEAARCAAEVVAEVAAAEVVVVAEEH